MDATHTRLNSSRAPYLIHTWECATSTTVGTANIHAPEMA